MTLSPKRKGRITGSVAGAILGVCPYMTRDDVMRMMVRDWHGAEREFKGNPATEWGKFNEPHVMAMQTDVVPNEKFFIHPEYDWLGATPDGFMKDDSDAVYELKCPYSKRNDEKPEFKPLKELPHYYAQTQIEMLCAGKYKTHFHQWAPNGERWDFSYRDTEWLDQNIPKLELFWHEYLHEREYNYEKYLEPLVQEISDSVAAEEYKMALEELEAAKAKLERAKESLIKQAGGKKSKIDGLNVYLVEKKGSIAYSKIVKDKLPGLDLEEYRGKALTYWVVK